MTSKILKYVVYDALRSRVIMAYAFLLMLIGLGFVYMQHDPSKTVISLLNIVLLIVPLVSIVFGTIYYYNSHEFIELTMAQPVQRRSIFLAQYLGFSTVLAMAVVLGLGIPLLMNGITPAGIYLLIVATLLSFVFTGLAFLASVYSSDKAKGIGLSLILWFYFSILYDALVLSILFFFSDYPLEKPVLLFTALNPIDLSRIIILINTDASALMGYTGALYQKFFGSAAGVGISLACMFIWAIIPTWLALRKFSRKDF